MNQVVLTGNLGADPEVFYSSAGNPIANFTMAFRSGKKTGWTRVVCFAKQAEIAERYLHKGARIGITATLDHNKWETNEGEARSNLQLIANQIEFIKTDGRGFKEGQQPEDDIPF